MPNLTKEQIEALMQGATKGPWRIGKWDDPSCASVIGIETNYKDAELIVSAPDIAQTALDLYARVEEMEKEIEDLHTNLANVTKLVKFKREPN